jgi:hypothetical protein
MISASQSRFDRAAGAILLRLRTQPSFNNLLWPDPQFPCDGDSSQCLLGFPPLAFHLGPVADLPFDAAVIATGSTRTHL